MEKNLYLFNIFSFFHFFSVDSVLHIIYKSRVQVFEAEKQSIGPNFSHDLQLESNDSSDKDYLSDLH